MNSLINSKLISSKLKYHHQKIIDFFANLFFCGLDIIFKQNHQNHFFSVDLKKRENLNKEKKNEQLAEDQKISILFYSLRVAKLNKNL